MVTAMRPLTVFLSAATCLIVGCSYESLAPAAEADALGAGLDESGFGQGTVWNVGPDREYKTPSAVAGRVGDGDVVLIDAATYECDTGVIWRADHLTLKGVGGRPHLAAEGCGIPGGKGIWNPAGTDLLIDNIEFSGAAVSDENGAGIRFEGDGQVIVRNSYFHHNENGILFTPPFADSTDLLIEHSEFAYNGTSTGQAHNLYINGARSLTFRYNDSHDSHVGHLLKTRANSNYILYNRIATMGGTGSFEIDIAHGGDSWIVGNIIQQGPVSENKGLIAYGAEATLNPGTEYAEGHLYVINNTIINDRADGADLIALFDYESASLQLTNNLFVDIPESELDFLEDQGAELDGNLLTDRPGFQDRERYNYALTVESAAIGEGVDPGADHLGNPLRPDRRYRHPTAFEARDRNDDEIDIGALDFSEPVPKTPGVTLTAESTAIDYGADAVLRWTAEAASRCRAGDGWSGDLANEGEARIGPLNQQARFEITCDGEGGTARATLEIDVADHPLAAGYPDYRFVELEGTAIQPLCQEEFPYVGVQGCDARDLSAAYVPEQNTAYFFGGGHRAYFGNEVISLDLDARDLSVVFGPTDLRETRNFNAGHEGYYDIIHDCSGVWDLVDGGIAPAPASLYSGWIYAPPVERILKLGGMVACGEPWFDTDSWWFDPTLHDWRLIDRSGDIADSGSHAVYDPDSRQVVIMGQYSIYRFDPEEEELIELGPFDDYAWSTTPVLDPVNDVIVIIGDGDYQHRKFTVIDIRGLDQDTKSLPEQQVWTATGDLSLLDMTSPGLAYDPEAKAVVGWGGGHKIHFLAIDREARKVEFIAKTLEDGPEADLPKRNTFFYAEKAKAFVAFAGADRNFHLLQAVP